MKLLLAYLSIGYLRRTAFPAKLSYREVCDSVAAEMHVRPPSVFQNSMVKTPFLTGTFRPAIFLPLGEPEAGLPSREIFIHELSHLKRRDPLWNLFWHIGIVFVPFQPLMWVLARLIEETSDYVSDDHVVKYTGAHREYAEKLVYLARKYHSAGLETTAAVGFVSFKSSLKRRIINICDTSRTLYLHVKPRIALFISSLCIGAMFLSGLVGIRGKSFGQIQKIPQTVSRKASAMVIAAATATREQIAEMAAPKGNPPPEKSVSQVNIPDTVPEPASLDGSEGAITGIAAENSAPAPAASVFSTEDAQRIPDTIPSATIAIGGNRAEARTVFQTAAADVPATSKTAPSAAPADSLTRRNEPQIVLATRMSREKDSPAPIPVPVQIYFNYKDADKNDPEEKRLIDIYEAADRNQMNPIWSPDGKRIAFSDPKFGIWMVSVAGGEPVLVYDNYHKSRYMKYDLQLAGLQTLSFTPDGKEVVFTVEVIDQEKGTKIEIHEIAPNISYTIYCPFPVIASVNIATGEKRIIAEDTRTGSMSRDGRYFTYIRDSVPELHVKDLLTGEDRLLLNGEILSSCFSASNQYVLYSRTTADGSVQVFRIPVQGGTQEQLTFRGKDDPFTTRMVTDCSPDGEWVLFSGIRSERSTIGVFNTMSGKMYDLFPDEIFSLNSGKFSSDGEKICFSLSASDEAGQVQKLYLCNFVLRSETSGTTMHQTGATPASFNLPGNFPNPFNASTTICFSLPSAGFVRLYVYNTIGQKIRGLFDGEMPPGTHSIVWNGKDDHGMTVSTGIYISHLQWGSHTATRRMTLIK